MGLRCSSGKQSLVSVLLFIGWGDPVRVLSRFFGVTQDGLSRVAVVGFVQGDVFDDEGGQCPAVSRHTTASTCPGTEAEIRAQSHRITPPSTQRQCRGTVLLKVTRYSLKK